MSKNYFWYVLCVLLLISTAKLSAQVTIGSGNQPLKGALLDLKQYNDIEAETGGRTADKGLGMPRVGLLSLTTTDNNLASTINKAKGQWNTQDHIGLLVFNTTKIELPTNRICPGLHVWNGDLWFPIVPYPTGIHYCNADDAPTLPFIINAPDITTCAGTAVYLTATASEGATIYWYMTAEGGSPIATGTPFKVNPSNTTTYYVKAEKDGIKSATRTAVVVTVNALPTITDTTPNSRCGTGTVNISAAPSNGATVRWYTTATGGTALVTNKNYTTPNISVTTTYYAEAYNETTGCVSDTRTPVIATVNALPTITETTPNSRCGAGVVALSATASTGASVRWYTTATGGTALVTNKNYTTPNISVTTTYYAEAYNATTGCISATRTAVVATVNALPTITGSTPNSRCGAGTVSLSAIASTGASVRWYTTATGGTALATNNNYTTPSISVTTTYYAEAYNATTGCVSDTRTPVIATVNALPTIIGSTPKSRCGAGAVSLSATASTGASVRWYAAATGGTVLATNNNYTTPSISVTTTYYAEAYNETTGCVSDTRTPVIATVNALPTITETTPNSRCGTGTVNISAAPSNGATVHWYTTATGGTVLATNNNYTTPSISVTTTYYAEAYNETTGCISATRTAVVATVNTLPTITGSTPNSRCGAGTVTLSATASTGGSVRWYTAATGGTVLATSNNYTTPSISVTTTYYAEAYNATTGCISATRTAVLATVNALPTITGSTPNSRCGAGTVTLSATASTGASVRWYTASTGGTALITANNYTTPHITTNTTYYAEAYNATTGCISATRTAVLATVNALPTITGSTPNSRCGAGTVALSATASTGASVRWYTAATGGTVLATNNNYTTPSISVTTTYYAEAYNATTGCASATRTAVVATVIPLPTITATTPSSTCGPGTVILSATASDGASIRWFTATNAVLPVGMGSSFTTPRLTSNTTYYAEAYNKTTGCISDTRTPVVATVKEATTIEVTDAWLERAGTGTMKATATSSTGIRWYNTPTGGNVINTGGSYTVNATVPTVYYVEAYNTTTGCISERVEVWIRPCGAWVSSTKYKYFKCHNLGATDTSLNPSIPSKGISGSHYQWGRKDAVATVDTPTEAIVGWNKTPALDNALSDVTKTVNDPCPAGWRIPTGEVWENIVDLVSTLNPHKAVGKWTMDGRESFKAGAFIGHGLFLPAAGIRMYHNGLLQMQGASGNYEASTLDTANNGAMSVIVREEDILYFNSMRLTGQSIRCMEE